MTKAVYHRGSHMEGTCALKLGLVARGKLEDATVRSPLMPLAAGAAEEIRSALKSGRAHLTPPAGACCEPSAKHLIAAAFVRCR